MATDDKGAVLVFTCRLIIVVKPKLFISHPANQNTFIKEHSRLKYRNEM